MTASKIRPHRRWFRFSIRTMLLLVTASGIWMGLQVHRAKRTRQALAELNRLEAHVFFEHEWDMSAYDIPSFKKASVAPGPQWLRRLVGDEYFLKVSGATVTRATDELQFLNSLPGLEALSIVKSAITDKALERLESQSRLRYLWLDDTAVSDAGLPHLQNLKSLRFLYLRNTKVTSRGVKQLKQFLPDTRITYGSYLGEQSL